MTTQPIFNRERAADVRALMGETSWIFGEIPEHRITEQERRLVAIVDEMRGVRR